MGVTQESESTGMSLRELDRSDRFYVRLVNSALNGTKFYVHGGTDQKYDILEGLGNVGVEYAKRGKPFRAQIISNFLKVKELAENNTGKRILEDSKGNKWGFGYKVNAGGHPVDDYGNPIDVNKPLKRVDYSGKIDKELKVKGGYAGLLDKESREMVRKMVWASSTRQRAIDFDSDGDRQILEKYLGNDGDFGKAEENFYSAARGFEAIRNKKRSEMLYAKALACRMFKEGNYNSAMKILKESGDKFYGTVFSDLIKKEKIKERQMIEKLLKNIGVPKSKEALSEYTDKLIQDIETEISDLPDGFPHKESLRDSLYLQTVIHMGNRKEELIEQFKKDPVTKSIERHRRKLEKREKYEK